MLCKCSGKYIDIYFILKITFYKKCMGEKSKIKYDKGKPTASMLSDLSKTLLSIANTLV